MGALGAGLFSGSIIMLLFYALGAVERRRWDGKVPTIHEYMYEGKNRKKSSIMQLQAARLGRRGFVISVAGVVIGGALMIVGALSR